MALITAIYNCSSLQERVIDTFTLVFDDEWLDASTEEFRTMQPLTAQPDTLDSEESMINPLATEKKHYQSLSHCTLL